MKPTSRRSCIALAAAAVSMALLGACGGGGGSTDAASAGKPVTLTYWGWIAGAKELADAFNRSHKDIQVRFSQIAGGPDGYAKISNAIKAGNAPDVAGIEYTQLAEFASQGLLEDLSEEAGETVRAKFPQSVQGLVTLGGKTWAVPSDVAPQLYFYRKDLFEKYGVEVPKTWDEFRAAGEKIKKADKDVRIAAWPDNDPVLLAALSWQAGGKWFGTEGTSWKVGVDDAASRKVAAYWQGLADDDIVSEIPTASEEETKARASGTVAGFIGASWSGGATMVQFPKLSGKWGIAPLPHWGTPASGMYGGTTFAVTKGSEHVKEAAVFATWATTAPEAIKARLSSMKTPSSALPANVELRQIAADAFTSDYFPDDIYAIAGAQVDTIVPGWAFGPGQIQTNTAIQDAAAKGTLTDGLTAGRQAAVKGIQDRGLSVAK